MAIEAFPLTVTVGDEVFRKARLYVTDDGHAYLFASRGAQVEIVAEGQTAGDTYVGASRRQAGSLTLSDDTVWTLAEGGGCGCGDPLKRRRGADLLRMLT